MPPKKSKTKKSTTSSSSVVHRQVKHKSTNLDYEYDAQIETNVDDVGKVLPQESAPPKNIEEVADAKNGIVSYYLALIDLYANTRHVFQIFMLCFLTNLIYLCFKKQEEDGSKDAMEKIITASCIVLAALLECFAVLNSRFRQFEAGKTKVKPQLLDFNYIYSVFFPMAICLVKAPNKVVLISCCVVQIGYMNILVRGLISYVILFQFGDSQNFTGKTLLLPIASCFFYEMINQFVGDEIEVSEKSFLSVILTAGSFLINHYESNITLFIMRNLYLSFIIGMILSSPILELYKSQTERTLKYTWLLGIYLLFFSAGLIVSDKLLLPSLGKFHLNWLIDFISTSNTRKSIFQYWLISSSVLIPGILIIFSKVNMSLSLKRKVWHFVIFALLVKPMIVEPELVSVALFGVLGILIIVEMVRANELPPFGGTVRKMFANFQDSKDNQGKFILSYIYLVVGIALPLWTNNVDSLKESSYIGLLTLGLGDSIASMVGSKFGHYHWPETNKTLEGSAAMVAGMMGGYVLLDYLFQACSVQDKIVVLTWTNRFVCAVLCALFEGIVDVNDNLFLPVFGYLVEELFMFFN